MLVGCAYCWLVVRIKKSIGNSAAAGIMAAKRHFASARDFVEKRMPHLIDLYTYNGDGSIADLNRAFQWSGQGAFELDVFVCDTANFEAENGSTLFV